MSEGDDLLDLEIVACASLRRWGLADAEAIASHLVADLRRQLAGSTVYVSKGFRERNQQIKMEFNGRNAAKIAARFGLSRRRVDQILQDGQE